MKTLKRLFIILVGVYGLYCAFTTEKFNFLDGADLLFHEAGHQIFGGFGEFIGMLGGTLMQLLVPTVIIIRFFRTRQAYSAAVVFFWLAHNFFNISRYVKDSNLQKLPLVGGGIHDWHYLLSRMNLLPWDQQIGDGIWLAGMIILACSVILGFHYASGNPSQNNTSSEISS